MYGKTPDTKPWAIEEITETNPKLPNEADKIFILKKMIHLRQRERS